MSGNNSILFVVCLFVMVVIPEPSSSATTSRDLDVETTTVATISTTEIDSSTVTNIVTEDAGATTFKDLVELIDVSTTNAVTQAEEFDSGETLTTPPQIANDKPTEPIPDIDVISTVSKSESIPSSDERSIQVYSTSEEVESSATLTSVDPDVDRSGTTSPSVASNEIKSRFDDDEGQINPTPNSPSSGSGYFYEKPSIPFEFESQMSSQVDSFNGYDYPKPAKLFTYPSETDVNQINSDNFGGFYYY